MTRIPERYSIAVPAGWIRLPGHTDPSDAAEAAISEALSAGAPNGDWTTEVGSQLKETLQADSFGLVLDSYVPAGGIPETDISCSVVVAAVEVDSAPSGDLDELLLAQLGKHRGQILQVAGAPAVRWWEHEPPAHDFLPTQARSIGARVVLTRIPQRSDVLLMLRLTVASTADAPEHENDITGEQMVLEALGVLFDAMCASVQWRTNDGAHLVVEADGTMSG